MRLYGTWMIMMSYMVIYKIIYVYMGTVNIYFETLSLCMPKKGELTNKITKKILNIFSQDSSVEAQTHCKHIENIWFWWVIWQWLWVSPWLYI